MNVFLHVCGCSGVKISPLFQVGNLCFHTLGLKRWEDQRSSDTFIEGVKKSLLEQVTSRKRSVPGTLVPVFIFFTILERFQLFNYTANFLLRTITCCGAGTCTQACICLVVGAVGFCQPWRMWVSRETFHHAAALLRYLPDFCSSASIKINPKPWNVLHI